MKASIGFETASAAILAIVCISWNPVDSTTSDNHCTLNRPPVSAACPHDHHCHHGSVTATTTLLHISWACFFAQVPWHPHCCQLNLRFCFPHVIIAELYWIWSFIKLLLILLVSFYYLAISFHENGKWKVVMTDKFCCLQAHCRKIIGNVLPEKPQ